MCFLTWLHLTRAQSAFRASMAAAPHLSLLLWFPLCWLHLSRQRLKLLFPFPLLCRPCSSFQSCLVSYFQPRLMSPWQHSIHPDNNKKIK